MRSTINSGCASAFAIAVSLALTPPALAQEAVPVASQTSPTGTRVEGAENSGAALVDTRDDIVVTARRSEESIQSAPVSVTAFNGESLRDAGIQKTEDLMVKTPGVYLGGSGGRENSVFQIRGQSKARSGFNSPAVVSYFADVPLPTFGSGVPTFDMQSVQVLKGPQGTLFGRNTTGGAILFYPTVPNYEFGGYVEVGYGNYDNKQLQAALTIPVVDGKVALRLSGQLDKRDGWTRDITYNVRRDGNDSKAFRVSLLLEPFDGLKNVTIYDFYDNEYNGDGVVLTNIRTVAPLLPAAFGIRAAAEAALARQQARGPRIVESDSRPIVETRRQGISNRTDLDITDDVAITNIFGYRRTHLFYVANSEGLPRLNSTTIPGASFSVLNGSAIINTEQFTDELQFKGSLLDNKVEWLVGGFYLHGRPYGPTGTGSLQFYSGPPGATDISNFGYNFITEDSRAVFGNAVIDLASLVDGLKLSLGARYTWDKQKSCVGNDTTTQGRLAPSDCASGNPSIIRPSVNRTKSDAPTWQGSLEWQATPELFAYVVSRRGYRAGGLNAPTLAGRLAPFQSFGPEKVTDVEGGIRSDWNLGGDFKFRFNASAFLANFSDVAFSLSGLRTTSVAACTAAGGAFPTSPDGDCNPNNDPISGALTTTAGRTRVTGLDIDGFLAFNRQLRFTYAYSYLNPKSRSIDLPPVLLPYLPTGTSIGFDFVAKNSYSLGAEWDVPVGDSKLEFGADLYHSGSRSFVDERFPAYTIMNARVAWADPSDHIEISAYASNLFDKTYISQGSFGGPAAGITASIFGAPRQYGVRARYRFGA